MALARFWVTLVVLLAVLGLRSALWPQSNIDGAIGGAVTDPSGALVARASISARNVDTNERNAATSDAQGAYRITHLRPGTYEVTINTTDFLAFRAERIIVELGRVTLLQARLEVGTRAEVVQVKGESPVIDTVHPELSNNINAGAISYMPINARRWSSLAFNTPATVPDGQFGILSFRGIAGMLNSNTVDGGDNNNAYFSEERGRTRITATIGLDAIREIEVSTSNFSADYGRAAGGVFNAVTKSGGNAFHGLLKLFATDSALWAFNPFSVQAVNQGGKIVNVPLKPEDRRWQFGGNFGGPIRKDKLFFFFNWDQQKEDAPGVATPAPDYFNPITVAKPLACSGALTSGQILWCRGSLPVFDAVAGRWITPVPNAPGVTQAQVDAAMAFMAGLTGLRDRNKDQYALFSRIDWIVTPSQSLTVSWNRMRWNSRNGIYTQPIVNRADWGDDYVDVDTVNARLVSILSHVATNELRGSVGRENQFEPLGQLKPGEPTTGPGGLSPEVNVAGYTFGRPYYTDRKAYPLEFRAQFADTLSLLVNKHLLKVGTDINYTSDTIDHLPQNGGAYNFNTIADWISDTVAWQTGNLRGLCNNSPSKPADVARYQYCYSSFAQGIGPTKYSFATTDYSLFAQDDWRALPRLTLNFGMRWDYQSLPSPMFPNAALPQTAITPSDKLDFGPRAGFVFDIFGNGKTVVRGGYALSYGRVANAFIGQMLISTGAAESQLNTGPVKPCQYGALCPSAAPLYPYTAGKAGTPAPSVWGRFALPRAYQLDFVVQREIGRNTAVSATLLYTAGENLPLVTDANLPPATTITYFIHGGPMDRQMVTFPWYTGRRPNTSFNQVYTLNFSGYSRYTGMVLQFNRRMTDGLQIQASYTHARATDNNQHTVPLMGGGLDALDPHNQGLEGGSSPFDIRHRAAFAAIWQPQLSAGKLVNALLNGFSFAPVVTIMSGNPTMMNVSGNAPGSIASGILGAGGANRWPLAPKLNGFLISPTTGGADLRIGRHFRIREDVRFEVIGEVFNVSNHLFPTAIATTYYQISGTTPAGLPILNWCGIGTVTGYCSPSISAVGTTLNANSLDRVGRIPRQFQLGARFEF